MMKIDLMRNLHPGQQAIQLDMVIEANLRELRYGG
jgi:hypothetical protein